MPAKGTTKKGVRRTRNKRPKSVKEIKPGHRKKAPVRERLLAAVRKRAKVTRNSYRVLTIEQIEQITEGYLDHEPIAHMAKRLQVTPQAIRYQIKTKILPAMQDTVSGDYYGHLQRLDHIIRLGMRDWRECDGDDARMAEGGRMVRWGMTEKARLLNFEPPKRVEVEHAYRVAGMEPKQVDKMMMDLLLEYAKQDRRQTVDAVSATEVVPAGEGETDDADPIADLF